MEQTDRLKIMLGDDTANTDTLIQALESAKSYILSYCNRDSLTTALQTAQVQLALLYINRQGMEGESAHSEGSVSRAVSFLPDDLRQLLNSQRLLKVVNRNATCEA